MVAQGFLALVLATTALLFTALIHELALRCLPTQVDARLISIHERRNSSGSYRHFARYDYPVAGQATRRDESSISWSAWHRLSKPFITANGRPDDIVLPAAGEVATNSASSQPAGELGRQTPQRLAVRAYAIGPIHYSRAVEHEWGFMYLLIPALFAPTLAFVSWAMYLAVVIRPRRVRRLYSHGQLTQGTVYAQRRLRSRYGNETLFADYTYTPAGESKTRVGTNMLAGEKEFAATTPGTAITVLYDSEKPRHSTAYEYGGYVCL